MAVLHLNCNSWNIDHGKLGCLIMEKRRRKLVPSVYPVHPKLIQHVQ